MKTDLIGLDELLRPRSLQLKLALALPTNLELARLDRWLNYALDLDLGTLVTLIPKAQPLSVGLASEFLYRVIAVSLEFLNLGRIPVFNLREVPTIADSSTNSDHFNASFCLVWVDDIPRDCYQIAVRYAVKLCVQWGKQDVDAVGRQKAWVDIDRLVIQPLTRAVPAGKSTMPVLRAADGLGMPYLHLGMGVYQVGWGSKAIRLDRSTTALDSAAGAKLAQNKVTAANLLRKAGLPAPVHRLVGGESEAHAAAQAMGFPVVVKPADSDRGEGVTVDIADATHLSLAFYHAQKYASRGSVVVERQVVGVCHRLFMVGTRLLYAVKRRPLSIQGDGVSTIAELVNAQCSWQQRLPPWKRSDARPIDAMALEALDRAGYTPQSIPPVGKWVALRRIESTEWGGTDEDVTTTLNSENVALAARAAQIFGLQVAGIDIISPDISVAWHHNGAIINEVNFAPLLGGGAISRLHIPAYLRELVEGDAKIPVYCFESDTIGWESAQAHWSHLVASGVRCYLTSLTVTRNHFGERITLTFSDLPQVVKAILCWPDVDALIIVH